MDKINYQEMAFMAYRKGIIAYNHGIDCYRGGDCKKAQKFFLEAGDYFERSIRQYFSMESYLALIRVREWLLSLN